MKKKILYGTWIAFYILCAGLGHVAAPSGAQRIALTILSLCFFVPGVILLVDALRVGDQKQLGLLRWISGVSLGLTLVFLVANVFSVLASEVVGNILYEVLIFVSVPMICSQHWVFSLFLWACLLFATILGRKRE